MPRIPLRRPAVQPLEDYGFFGPGSVTWKVWGNATALTVGFQRAVVVEEADPFLLASVDTTGKVRDRPRDRYDRTIRYFATIAMGDARSAVRASEILMRVHARARGIEPISGLPYDPNDPGSQLWIHLTGWHSVLYAYERYGPGPLTAEEEEQYWAECAVAAELQTCDPADVPRSREELRDYYASVRPRLAATEATQAMMDHLLGGSAILPPTPRGLRPAVWALDRSLRAATVATIPRWMRRLGDVDQPRIVDAAIVPPTRLAYRIASLNVAVQMRILDLISPSTRPIVEPALRGVKPRREQTMTPAQAKARFGGTVPAARPAVVAA
ncbi:MAG: oxygenase MpaB family protein [Solirubrobacteraceae bacterium]